MMIRSRTRRRRGLAMVESTFGLVIILFVTFGIIEYGQLIMARQLLANAAWDAANAASKGVQPATYDDGTPTPSPNGPVTTAYLNVVVAKAMAPAPLTGDHLAVLRVQRERHGQHRHPLVLGRLRSGDLRDDPGDVCPALLR